MKCDGCWHVLTRKKVLDHSALSSTKLSRCLNTGDLTALGVGSTLGVGIYVLAGHVAKELAGPSVVVSFFLAAIASVFAGLCYAEFGARVPRAGSAYIYSYVCIGEFVAFVVGWNLILEYIIGSASVSRGVSLYLDTLINNTLKTTFLEIVPIGVNNMSAYFDILAFCLVLVVGCGLAFGLKQSSVINNIFTVINLGIVIFVIAVGSLNAEVKNWFIPPEDIGPEHNGGTGGFFPFGFSGTLTGAATCFFGFIGFDCIATTGEEVQNPKKSIPLAILLSLLIIFLSYFGVSAIITLMLPYYLQDGNAPIPHVFEQIGWNWAKWVVSIGGMFGLLASLYGALFPLPRILYAMATDGLIFRFLGTVNVAYKTPVIGTILASMLTGFMAGCFELHQLVNLMSIGTLMAYTVVAACIIVLRCKCDDHNPSIARESNSLIASYQSEDSENESIKRGSESKRNSLFENDIDIDDMVVGSIENLSNFSSGYKRKSSFGDFFKQLFNMKKEKEPTSLSSTLVVVFIILFCILSLASGLFLKFMWKEIVDENVWCILILCIFVAFKIFIVISVAFQPRTRDILSFKVPLVPVVPFLSIFFNIYLMLMLDTNTWIRFGIWMAVGLLVYSLSLCMYGRGSNYVTNVQKSSINGHAKGNLNYAFENMTECQENEAVDMKVEPLSEAGVEQFVALELTDDEFISNLEDDTNERMNREIEQPVNVVSKSTTDNEYTPDAYGEEIFQMLDQVLKDAEDTSAKNDESNDRPYEESDKVSSKSIVIETLPKSPMSSLHDPLTHNVVALVHKEDIQSLGNADLKERRHISIIPINQPDDDSIDTEKDDSIDTINGEEISNDPLPHEVSIPVPPPMNEEFFNSAKPFIKFKAPMLDPNRKNERIHIKVARKSSLDESNVDMLTKTELIAKLNNLYENQARSPKRLTSDVYGGMHRSEPDLSYLLKNEGTNTHLSIITIPLHDEADGRSKTYIKPTGPGDNTAEIDEESVDKEEIKKKLESLFSKTPKMDRAKKPKNTEDTGNDDTEIKPKSMNFSNTMKLQRARFEDVLKSFEQSRLSVNSADVSIDDPPSTRTRTSILNKD